MKKYLVIGNPIEHSLSPLLHNYWIKKNNINAIYDKQKLDNKDLESLVMEIKNKKINGVNITVPFKEKIISFCDKLSSEAEGTQSVNTISLENDKIVGYNTDIKGFKAAFEKLKFNVLGKKIFILGAGGVVPSIVFSLNEMRVSEIIISNRTKDKAKKLNNLFKNISVIDWGELPNFDLIINATSVGLNDKDELNLDFSKIKNDKFFYDVIYNPRETKFLKDARKLGNETENGKKMFINQAAEAFKIWHGIQPEINEEVSRLLD